MTPVLNIHRRYRLLYKPLLFAAGSAPLVWSLIEIGPDPVEEMVHTFGKTALNFLLLTLLITPLRQLGGWPHLLRLRRMLGLFAFFYAVLHLLAYAVLDQGLDLAAVLEDIAKRPYITLGFTAVLILAPLAITSTNRMMRRLGRRWQKLHRLVYAAAILGVWHFYWQVKADIREPLIYAAMLAVLLGYRLYVSWRACRPVVERTATLSDGRMDGAKC